MTTIPETQWTSSILIRMVINSKGQLKMLMAQDCDRIPAESGERGNGSQKDCGNPCQGLKDLVQARNDD